MPGKLSGRACNGICQMDGINFINLMQSARINLQLPVKMQLILHLSISQSPLTPCPHTPYTQRNLTVYSTWVPLSFSFLSGHNLLANLTFSWHPPAALVAVCFGIESSFSLSVCYMLFSCLLCSWLWLWLWLLVDGSWLPLGVECPAMLAI